MMLKYHVLGGSQEYNPLDCTTTNNLAVLLRLGVQGMVSIIGYNPQC